ncbi:FtsK/SpoIIIE family DNA translocase [Gemmatimonas groenlandica]|uniref:DNA translocase FtsK n=1 Tax=Gemmatimonas groenlandica TaxID=2732249 RepID=A0A6M4ILX2_9BACT|nr:DNA translocase FtsK [Gemmatimonas groenlandica]QJR34868.1 DNA translocase FtsK [Gemmatimonas groenlandica]
MEPAVLRRELSAIALTLLAVFLTGALIFNAPDAGQLCLEATGVFGPAGTWARCALVSTVGIPGAAIVAMGCLVVALTLFGRIARADDASDWGVLFAGTVTLVPVAIGLALGGEPSASDASGLWGSFAAHYLRKGLGSAGAWVFFLLATSALTVATLRWNPIRLLLGPGRSVHEAGGEAETSDRTAVTGRKRRTLAQQLEPEPEELPAIDPVLARDVLALDKPDARYAPPESVRDSAKAKKAAKESTRPAAAVEAALDASSEPSPFSDDLPPTDLLTAAPARNADAGKRELDLAGEKLMSTLRTFKVDGELVGRTTGPTVTQFEIEPAPGVKVRQIAALADDLALAMRAPSIRIVAPIPGRGAVGVEVPNPTPEMVVLREVLESTEFRQMRAALPIALGKDLEGRAVIADLAKMPHLLIAGATGSGKSVCVNTIITSLAYRHTPRTLRFLMVDPKMVELSVYNTLPHLRHKVITDNRDAASVLKWAVMEMQDRYRLLEANACRNLQEFNRRVQQHADGEGAPVQKPRNLEVAFEDRTYTGGVLPYIVVVIDEMADLMMTVQGEVETPIAMLAQKARAIGIHLILATQRPSVNVITGLIKANFPCRIAFRVASQVDSRTIIDGAGAEALLGNGDMLFIPPGKSEPARLQGAYLSSEDTERLLKWYEDARARHDAGEGITAEPDILETVRALEAKGDGGDDDDGDRTSDDRDARFREAAEVVIQHRQGSTSLLQRRLKIGYGRAARIIDQLEAAGVLAPSEGAARPRDVLVGVQDLDRICGS